MKAAVIKLKTVVLITLILWSINSFAQVDETIMYVMKNGEVVFQSSVSNVDNVTFDKALSDSALIVRKYDDNPVSKILLNDITQLTFSDKNMSVETLGDSKVYAFEDIMKLQFNDINFTGINNQLAQKGFDVQVSVSPTNDIIVESSNIIKSISVYGVDGRMIYKQQCNSTVETLRATSLINTGAGIFLLRVETEQGVAFKKVVKPFTSK